jgi:hypothetical protein
MTKTSSPPNTALTAAWKSAEAAMLRYKTSLDPTDKARAVEKLWDVAREEAKIIARKTIDVKLSSDKRRDVVEMSEDAVSSVLASRNTRFTLLSEKFNPDRASLRTYMQRILTNKLLDYVRKEPIPGVIGRGNFRAATTLANEPPETDCDAAIRTPSSLRDFASTLGPTGEGAGRDAYRDDATTEDDHATYQLLGQLARYLPADSQEIFACEVMEMTPEEGLAQINQARAADGLTGLTADQYLSLLHAAQAALATHFPEYGATAAQQQQEDDKELTAIIQAYLTEKEAEVFDCCYRHAMTNDAGLAHLCTTHGEREGPDGKMYPYMSLSDYKRKLKSAREIIAIHLPYFRL